MAILLYLDLIASLPGWLFVIAAPIHRTIPADTTSFTLAGLEVTTRPLEGHPSTPYRIGVRSSALGGLDPITTLGERAGFEHVRTNALSADLVWLDERMGSPLARVGDPGGVRRIDPALRRAALDH